MEPLYPQKEMPDFNILGLLLGGRPYAANYFKERSDVTTENREQVRRGQFWDQMTASPEMRASNENPYDRKGQWDLLALSQHGPESAATIGANWFDKMVAGTNQRSNEQLADALAMKRIGFSADEEIRVAKAKEAMALSGQQKQMDALFGQDPQSPGMTKSQVQMQRNMAYEGLMGKDSLPSGYDVVPGPKGLTFQPTLGGPAWQQMTGEQNAADDVGALVSELSNMARDGTGGKGAWDTTRQLLMFKYKDLMKLGSLDAGAVEEINKMIPDRWDNWYPSSVGQGDLVREKLRVLAARNDDNKKQILDKWQVPAGTVANRSRTASFSKVDVPDPTDADFGAAERIKAQRSAVEAAKQKDAAKFNESMVKMQENRAKGGNLSQPSYADQMEELYRPKVKRKRNLAGALFEGQ